MPEPARAADDFVIQLDTGEMDSATIQQTITTSETYDSLSDFLLAQLQTPEMDALTPDPATIDLADFDFDGEIVETDTGFEIVIPSRSSRSRPTSIRVVIREPGPG